MKTVSKLFLSLVLAAASAMASADVTYSYVYDSYISFELTVADYITSNTTLSSLSSCSFFGSACASVSFYPDASASGLTAGDHGWSALSINTTSGSSTYFYFSSGAFAADGVYAEQQFARGTLTVLAVPEPSTYAMLLAGLGMLGFAARSKAKA